MKALICGKNKNFTEFIKTIVSDVQIAKTSAEALNMTINHTPEVLFMVPDYDLGKTTIDAFSDEEFLMVLSIINEEKTKIYLENYTCFDTRDANIIGCKQLSYPTPIGRNNILLSHEYRETLGGELLQKRDGIFIPNAPHGSNTRILAEIRNCLGVHNAVEKDDFFQGMALGLTHETVYAAMADFTNFDGYFCLPYAYWKRFFCKLFYDMLSIDPQVVEQAFCKIYSGIETQSKCRYQRDTQELNNALQEAISHTVQWHINSGIIPKPDGTGGVYEMIRSFDLNVAKNIRSDSSLFTSALFMLAGKYFDNPRWQEISRNIYTDMLCNHKLQIDDGANRGLFKWFAGVGKIKSTSVYISDTSRCANCIYALYKATGDVMLKEALTFAGEAILKWFNGNGLIGGGGLLDTQKWDLESIQSHSRTTSSEFYEAPMVFLKNMYRLTGEEKYKNQVIKTADALAKVHPTYGVVTSHSKNFTLSRALTVYAVAHHLSPDSCSNEITDILEYFRRRQHPCGGFADGEAYFDKESLGKNMEFAVGFGGDNGNICDMMYCHNTMLYTLNILRKSSNKSLDDKLISEMFYKALNFALNTQIKSQDKRLSGGWMRAYDMDLEEYYGCDKDFGWGAYSILTGWVTGAIPLVFLDLLGMDTMY